MALPSNVAYLAVTSRPLGSSSLTVNVKVLPSSPSTSETDRPGVEFWSRMRPVAASRGAEAFDALLSLSPKVS